MKGQEWQFGEGGEYLSLDFKQCQRSNGTIYGIPDKSNCAQKGAKAVSSSAGDGPLLQLRAQMAKDPNKFDKEVLSKLGKDGLQKLTEGLAKSNDPADKKIAEMAASRLKKMRAEEAPWNQDGAKYKTDQAAYGNWFKQQGYSNPTIRGNLAALNNAMADRGEITDKEFSKVADALKSKGDEYLKAKEMLSSRAKELRAPARLRTAAEKEEDRKRKARARGRLNRATIEALKNSGCTWEQIQRGDC